MNGALFPNATAGAGQPKLSDMAKLGSNLDFAVEFVSY